jgi:flagellar biosynthesis/type III secretory pathway ATPase
LDGHIILSRQLGAAGHYPAINVLESVSRLQSKLAAPGHKQAARELREALASFERASDLIQLGAYAQGTNPMLDSVIQHRAQIDQFLRQDAHEVSRFAETLEALQNLTKLLHSASQSNAVALSKGGK